MYIYSCMLNFFFFTDEVQNLTSFRLNFGFSISTLLIFWDSVGKESDFNVEDPGSIPRSGQEDSLENGNPLQYSCLKNPLDRGV